MRIHHPNPHSMVETTRKRFKHAVYVYLYRIMAGVLQRRPIYISPVFENYGLPAQTSNNISFEEKLSKINRPISCIDTCQT